MATLLTFLTVLAVVILFVCILVSLIATVLAWASTNLLGGLFVGVMSFVTNPWAIVSAVWLVVASATGVA